MGELEDLVRWGKTKGVQLRGVAPRSLPGRGTGVIATQRLKAGERVLTVPMSAVRSLDSVPKAVVQRLPGDISIQGLLATELALDVAAGRVTPWDAVLPSLAEFAGCMPIMWPAELQALLPVPVRDQVVTQQDKFDRTLGVVAAAFPELRRDDFQRAWFLIDSRSFLYETARMEDFPWEDRMAFMPVADLFNHAEHGCRVSFSPEGYTFTTRAPYRPGEEVHICYGQHTNDYLLAEYGFVMARNGWDEVCLDDAILPRLSAQQQDLLAGRGLLWQYPLAADAEGYHRTEKVLRVLCSSTDREWQQIVDDDSDKVTGMAAPKALLRELLKALADKAKSTLKEIEGLQVGEAGQIALLRLRWEQIQAAAIQAIGRQGTK